MYLNNVQFLIIIKTSSNFHVFGAQIPFVKHIKLKEVCTKEVLSSIFRTIFISHFLAADNILIVIYVDDTAILFSSSNTINVFYKL